MKIFKSKEKTSSQSENSKTYIIKGNISTETDNESKKENHPFKIKLFIFLLILLIIITVSISLSIALTRKSKKKSKSITKNIFESIELNPEYINGIAGENYTVNLSFPENICSEKINLTFTNSYNLSNDNLTISFEKNSTKCNFIIHLIQYKATINNTENIIKISKNGEEIEETISLIIKNADFDSLQYIEGPTDGNVINPPIITFIPLDKYGNLFNDIFINETQIRRNLNEKNVSKNKYSSKKEFLDSLTSVIFSNNNATVEVNNYIEGNKYIKIQYKSFKTGNVKLTSPYFKEEFNYRIKSGPLDLNNSYIEIINTEIIKIGDELKYIIHAKDLYGNDLDNLTEEIYIKIFENNSEKMNSKCNLNNDGKNDELKYNIIQCSEIVNETNYENIKKFVEDNINKCINCKEIIFEKYIPTTIVEEKKETEAITEKKEAITEAITEKTEALEEENPLLTVCKANATHPFWCLVNNTYTCTKSKTDCDCPEGYMKCENPNLQNYCVPKNRTDMCPVFKNQESICRMKGLKYFDDGVCRSESARLPNQRVCPGDKVLCADLTCRNNYDDCIITKERTKQYQRCVGQQLKFDVLDCYATITCSEESYVVCPDLTCVENEILCGDLKECPEDLPYLCANNECASDFDSCGGKTCEAYSLCEDGNCKTSC